MVTPITMGMVKIWLCGCFPVLDLNVTELPLPMFNVVLSPVRKHHKLLSTMSQRNDHEYCPLLRKRHSQKQMANREERE